MPPLATDNLRDCQIDAITGLEKSLALQKPRSLIHMATGAGKTFTAISSVYRLLKFAKAKRILFLVDTRNLGKQAHQEFMAFTPSDDKRKFTELYNVQRLMSSTLDTKADVCISTIQRMYSILSGEKLDEQDEDINLNEVTTLEESTRLSKRHIQYNPNVPIESFDFIIIDECHRSIYNLWKQVLDYFDAFLIGLTATPDNRTYGFFNENIVAEYSYEQSVVDGVNVGYDIYEIETEITKKGKKIRAKQWIDRRNRQTRAKRLVEAEEDIVYTHKDLDREVVNPSQIRNIIREMKRAVSQEIFPNREEVPKTLIFAKSDSHADDIINIVREEYGKGNEFCEKVTYSAKDPDGVLSDFRNEYNPRIAVTVDMIATGTDVKPLEVLLFMRDVRSKGYYEQMKGRGVRSLDKDGLQKVSQSASGAKTRFVIIDAVGVEKSKKTESRQLERKPSTTLKQLMDGIILGDVDEDTALSLANRLIRLNKNLDEETQSKITELTKGKSLKQITETILNAVDPDTINQALILDEALKGNVLNEDSISEQQYLEKMAELLEQAYRVFDAPELRSLLADKKDTEQIIDTVNLDKVINRGFSENVEQKAKEDIERFENYLKENREDIEALSFFYDQPYQRRELTLSMIQELHDKLSRPPLLLTTERLWTAYERVKGSQVKGVNTQRKLTDLLSLIRFASGLDQDLSPFSEEVDKRFKKWVFRHNAQNATAFTEEQMNWLRLMKDHIINSCQLTPNDFKLGSLANHGGAFKAAEVFGREKLMSLMKELNEELVA
ncbi:DEAD/DEAH box helicase family protein [Acinetobacter baumannii]|nr:DEAD/DEAH box helicase family protein [Acinetobacter baumannii]